MSKLITYRIVPPSAVVEWVFSDEIVLLHRSQWVWELLIMTCDQTVATIDLLQKKRNDLEDPSLSSQVRELAIHRFTPVHTSINTFPFLSD